MRAQRKSKKTAFAWPESSAVVTVTILHEDFEAGVRAKALCENLASQRQTPTNFKIDLWRFDLLQNPSPRIEAVNLSQNAAVVILAARSAESLPAKLEDWIDRWLRKRPRDGSPCSFILFLEKGRQVRLDGQPVFARLRQAANDGQLDLFRESWESWEGSQKRPEQARQSAAMPFTPPQKFRDDQPHLSWGINE